MTPDFLAFAIRLGAWFLAASIMIAWIFRTSGASLMARIIMPIALVALGISLPFSIREMMGYPIDTKVDAIPASSKLVAFVEHDRDNVVDLWLQEAHESPRAYRVPEDELMKKSMAEAHKRLKDGAPVYVLQSNGGKGQKFEIKSPTLPTKE